MPTKRTWIFLFIALILYILANQTQVGWIYVIAAGIGGILLVSLLYGRKQLRKLAAQRHFKPIQPKTGDLFQADNDQFDEVVLPTFHEDDAIEVTLTFYNRGFRPAFLIGGQEDCPFAPPAEQQQPFFIPSLFKNQPLTLRYQTVCDRRGLHTFGPLPLRSGGPFGFFSTKYTLPVSGDMLIYPQYHPLKRLRILEKREAGRRETVTVGVGTQVVGTRDYRPGDSWRQVHWRSTARRGNLVVKEFTDEDQLTLTVVLDLQHDDEAGTGKFSPFESAIRIAASLSHYAAQNNIPFHLVGASERWAPPKTGLSRAATLTYLAKVQNDGQTPLLQVLEGLPASPFLVVLASRPTSTLAVWPRVLQKHNQTLVIFITPGTSIPPPTPPNTSRMVVKWVVAEEWATLFADL